MANVGNKLMDWLGFGVEEVTEEDSFVEQEESEQELYETPRPKQRKERKANNSKVVSLPAANRNKMVVYYPVSYEDTMNIIDNLTGFSP